MSYGTFALESQRQLDQLIKLADPHNTDTPDWQGVMKPMDKPHTIQIPDDGHSVLSTSHNNRPRSRYAQSSDCGTVSA